MKLAAHDQSPLCASAVKDAIGAEASDAQCWRALGVRMRARLSRLMHRLASQDSPWRRAAFLIALCTVLVMVSSSAALHGAILQVLGVIEGLISHHSFLGAGLFVLVAALTAMVTFVSAAVVVPAAVLAWGEMQSIALLWAGWVLGGLAAYAIGGLLGRPIARFLLANDALQDMQGRLQQRSHFLFVLLVQLALPTEVIGYALGMVRYPLLRYLAALSIAELPYTIATVRLGASFVSGRAGLIFATGLSIALISLVAFYLLRYEMRNKSGTRTKRAVGQA